MADAAAVWSHERLRDQNRAAGNPYNEVLRVDSLSAGVYALAAGARDGQAPHAQDEVYVVLAGSAAVEIDGRREPVSTGSLIYVPRGVDHRFVDISDDLEVVVVFAPPETA